MRLALVLVGLLALLAAAQAADWAVIVAGSNGYYNYRHQADACHAYHVVSKNGIPSERIIVMIYDDIASDSQNPFPGQMFNKPTDAGVPGVDVYAGCQKDYTGEDVTAENFLNVLTGNAAATKGKKVLKSTKDDNVFIFFSDHGGTGIIAFPAGPYLGVSPLNAALRKMNTANMYKKLVFYMEACESGSMFENVLPSNLNIYVTTASNAVESSWGCYCPPEDSVNGKSMGSCLGDLYSVNWMEDADKQSSSGMKETLAEQYVLVKDLTTQSHVMQYGDMRFTNDTIGEFMGEVKPRRDGLLGRTAPVAPAPAAVAPRSAGVVDSRDIKLHSLYYAYLRADKDNLVMSHAAAGELQKEINHRIAHDNLFASLAQSMVSENWSSVFHAEASTPVVASSCVDAVHAAVASHCGGFSDYSLRYVRVVYNLCAASQHSNSATSRMVSTVKFLCSKL